jgi:hypothetical protein
MAALQCAKIQCTLCSCTLCLILHRHALCAQDGKSAVSSFLDPYNSATKQLFCLKFQWAGTVTYHYLYVLYTGWQQLLFIIRLAEQPRLQL